MPLKSRMLLQTLDAIDNLDCTEGSTVNEIIQYIQGRLKIKGREAHPAIITLVKHALFKGVQLGLLCQHGLKYFRYKKYDDDFERGSSDNLIARDSYDNKTMTTDVSSRSSQQSDALTDSTIQPRDKCPKRKRVRKFKVCFRRKRKNRKRRKGRC